MDLAIYINELLGLKGEVNVPGVGIFAQKRISGYYSEHEGKFYPPRHEIIFDPQPKDDDGLAAYISQKKNISPASAKYFIEKYATGLKQEATVKSAAITGLGHLFYEYSTLSFKADKDAQGNDPAFYGFAPVEAHKVGDNAAPEAESVPEKEPVAEPAPVTEETPKAKEEPVAQQEWKPIFDPPPAYSEEEVEEPEEPRRGRPWVVVLLIVIIGLLCFGVAYQYRPEWFGKRRPVDTTIIVNGPPPAAKQPDTVKAVKADTPKTTAIDTFGVKRFELLAGSFKKLSAANSQMGVYRRKGLHPRLLPRTSGKAYKVTLGTYFDEAKAYSVADSILAATKFGKNDIYVQPYNPIK
jgi:hypothetical protein